MYPTVTDTPVNYYIAFMGASGKKGHVGMDFITSTFLYFVDFRIQQGSIGVKV